MTPARRLFDRVRATRAVEVRARTYYRRLDEGVDRLGSCRDGSAGSGTLAWWLPEEERRAMDEADRRMWDAEDERMAAAGPRAIAGVPCDWDDKDVPPGVVRLVLAGGGHEDVTLEG